MHRISVSILLVLFLFIMGCAGPGSTVYNHTDIKPKEEFTNEIYVDKNFEVIWNNLIKNLSESYYVVNNISKESRFINVSFATDDACKFVTCGKTNVIVERTVPFNKKGMHTYDYMTCEDSSYTIQREGVYPNLRDVIDVNRSTSLEGRMNIYIAPEGKGTRISVNVRYIFNVDTYNRKTVYALAGNPVPEGYSERAESHSCSFSTNQTKRCPKLGDIKCRDTGYLEKQILNLAL